jgi:hypothetical protein
VREEAPMPETVTCDPTEVIVFLRGRPTIADTDESTRAADTPNILQDMGRIRQRVSGTLARNALDAVPFP